MFNSTPQTINTIYLAIKASESEHPTLTFIYLMWIAPAILIFSMAMMMYYTNDYAGIPLGILVGLYIQCGFCRMPELAHLPVMQWATLHMGFTAFMLCVCWNASWYCDLPRDFGPIEMNDELLIYSACMLLIYVILVIFRLGLVRDRDGNAIGAMAEE